MIVDAKMTVEIAQLWQHNRGNFTTPTIYQKKKKENLYSGAHPRVSTLIQNQVFKKIKYVCGNGNVQTIFSFIVWLTVEQIINYFPKKPPLKLLSRGSG